MHMKHNAVSMVQYLTNLHGAYIRVSLGLVIDTSFPVQYK